MSAQKWWQDNDRYIPNPWDEIELLRKELDQMSITEAALRGSLTELSRESLEYRLKIETENAALREKMKVSWDEISALINQNCALREDKARLDSGTILLTVGNGRVHHIGVDLRAAIESGWKGRQP